MSDTLYQTLRQIVRDELGSVRGAELALVEEQHPHASDGDRDNYACTVKLRDSGLLLRRVPLATARLGVASLPAVGDLVLVQFIGGDVQAPVVVGSLYNDEQRPPLNEDGQAVMHLPQGAAPADALRLVVSSADQRQVQLDIGAALSVTLQDDDPVVRLDVAGGKAVVEIARDGSLSVTSKGDLALEAGAIEVKGREITLEAQGQLNLKGATVNLN